MKTIELDDNEYEFLKSLQYEMLTQDTVGQANPRFWVVRETRKLYRVDNEIADGWIIYDIDNCCECYDCEGEIDLEEWFEEEIENIGLDKEDFSDIDKTDEDDIIRALSKYGNYETINYINNEYNVPDTMFLTLRECKEHIKANSHHYNETAHPYAMTAWRSPQVLQLYSLIEKVKFKEC